MNQIKLSHKFQQWLTILAWGPAPLQARTQTPGWGGAKIVFENFWGVYGRKNEGGARSNPEGGGRNPQKRGKSTFFLGKFSSWGGRAAPSPPPCVRAWPWTPPCAWACLSRVPLIIRTNNSKFRTPHNLPCCISVTQRIDLYFLYHIRKINAKNSDNHWFTTCWLKTQNSKTNILH